jgi:hypothetical protein
VNSHSKKLKSLFIACSLAPIVTMASQGVVGRGRRARSSALRAEAPVKASAAEVWRAWTTSDGAQTFFAPKANIELVIGSPYEIFFSPADERMRPRA